MRGGHRGVVRVASLHASACLDGNGTSGRGQRAAVQRVECAAARHFDGAVGDGPDRDGDGAGGDGQLLVIEIERAEREQAASIGRRIADASVGRERDGACGRRCGNRAVPKGRIGPIAGPREADGVAQRETGDIQGTPRYGDSSRTEGRGDPQPQRSGGDRGAAAEGIGGRKHQSTITRLRQTGRARNGGTREGIGVGRVGHGHRGRSQSPCQRDGAVRGNVTKDDGVAAEELLIPLGEVRCAVLLPRARGRIPGARAAAARSEDILSINGVVGKCTAPANRQVADVSDGAGAIGKYIIRSVCGSLGEEGHEVGPGESRAIDREARGRGSARKIETGAAGERE